ncbi:hypothetical protein ACEWY4_018329 [Coilia grayii]|uniref:DDE Tnp4 domain-containing protein n=1 Tax=Coilia grayii TaxID=363190 RepID=A0ABD1JLK2_9TELE
MPVNPHTFGFVFLFWRILCNRGNDRIRRILWTRRQDTRRQYRERLYAALAVASALNASTAERMLGAHERSGQWWERDVLQTFSDAKWKDNFRMSKATSEYLCEELQPRLSRRRTPFRSPISVSKRLGLALYYLATGCDFRTLGNLFGIANRPCVPLSTTCASFLNINVGWPGSVHDARVLRNSKVFALAEDCDLFPDDTRDIHGTPVPIMLLGDPAYPLLPWLIKGYPESGQLPREKRHFNYRLSRARMVVECAFGRLKGRWRCLLKRLDVDILAVVHIVGAACVLHNVCEMREEEFDEQLLAYDDDLPAEPNQDARQDARCRAVREALTRLFAEEW